MGNRVTLADVTPNTLSSLEYKSAALLLAALKSNDDSECLSGVKSAIDIARKQYISEHALTVGGDPYVYLVKHMIAYLTRKYDIGDGPLFTKTPLEFLATQGRDQHEAAHFICKVIDTYSRCKTSAEAAAALKAPSSSSSLSLLGGKKASAGDLEAEDRVAQAKARLQAFKDQRNKNKT